MLGASSTSWVSDVMNLYCPDRPVCCLAIEARGSDGPASLSPPVVSQVEPLSQSTLERKPCENAVKSLHSVIQVHGKNSARSIQEEFRGLNLCVSLLGINLQSVHSSDKYGKDVLRAESKKCVFGE